MIRDGKKMRTAHRVSYEEHYNVQIPKGKCVLHSCDNTKCVNPNHLWLGSHKDNTQDMIRKGRNNYFADSVVAEIGWNFNVSRSVLALYVDTCGRFNNFCHWRKKQNAPSFLSVTPPQS